MNICNAFISKHNANHEEQIILLMIPNGEGRYYLGVKKLFALLREITSKHDRGFYYLKNLHSFRTKNKPESHKKYVIIKILEFNHYRKSDEKQSIIYAVLEHFTKKIHWSKNNFEKWSSTILGWHIQMRFSNVYNMCTGWYRQ